MRRGRSSFVLTDSTVTTATPSPTPFLVALTSVCRGYRVVSVAGQTVVSRPLVGLREVCRPSLRVLARGTDLEHLCRPSEASVLRPVQPVSATVHISVFGVCPQCRCSAAANGGRPCIIFMSL